MANPIKVKKSTVPGLVPSSGSLLDGELALNLPDGKMWYGYNNLVYQFPQNLAHTVQATPPQNPTDYDRFINSANGMEFFYDPLRNIWLSAETVLYHFSYDGNADNVKLYVGNSNHNLTGYSTPYPGCVVAITAFITSGNTGKIFALQNANSSFYTFQLYGTHYREINVDARMPQETVYQCYCDNAGASCANPQVSTWVKWYMLPT